MREFKKSHGLGNDYLLLTETTFGLSLNPARIRRLCDRHLGIGSDGILLQVSPPAHHDVAVRIFNPDGSEAEKSGNGVRIFAAHCFASGADLTHALSIHTKGGQVSAQFLERRCDEVQIAVSMGKVSFRMRDLPMLDAVGQTSNEEWVDRALNVDGTSVRSTCLSIGNPHAVLLGAVCDETTLRTLGPLVENHPQFPQRTNVQLCEVLDRRRVRALIWERGAGVTLASGSSACAVAAAGVRAGKLDADADLEVIMPGGILCVRVASDGRMMQTGPVAEVCAGIVSDALWHTLEGLP